MRILFALLLAWSGLIGTIESVALPITVASPDSAIKFDLRLRSENRLSYRVTMHGRPVIELSRAGIIVDGINLGDGASVSGIERTQHAERYETRGVHAVAVNRYNSAKVALVHLVARLIGRRNALPK